MKSDVVIIGGGIAGLATGALLAKAGRRAVVLEKGNQPGGRAYAYTEKGYTLNYGAHAMYRPHTGLLGDILRRLGRPDGAIRYGYPDPMRAYWSLDGRMGALGAKPHQLLMTKLFPLASRVRLVPFMLAIRSAKPETLGDMTFGDWLRSKTSDPLLLAFGRAFGTVNTYTRPSAALSAAFVLAHLQRNLFAKDYVGYMSGGWATMYNLFIEELRAGGGELVTGAHVDELEVRDGHAVAAIASGERYEADAFVCTLPPQDAPHIAAAGTALAAELSQWADVQDVRALCMDLGFSKRFETAGTFVFDVERDLYYSLHSEVTPDLAPEGGQLLHAMAYLSPEESSDERLLEQRKRELEGGLDTHFAGWSDAIAVERTIPNVRVSPARWTPDQFRSRALPQRAASARNLYFAGDARDLGYALAANSLASAIEVADAIVASLPPAGATREAVTV